MDQLRAEDPAFIGPYRLVGRLGAGGMGVVHRAEAPDGQAVAVKLVRAEAAADEEFRRRFAREVRAARLVGDAWTARVLDADTDADVPWVATEYVPGPSLRAAVEGRLGPLPAASVFVLAHRLALALRAIHGAGLIHRDLKPSNILLTVGGPRVIDFGIARRTVLSSESDLTRTGVLVGSPEFMSPEQVRGDEVTPAGDVFSLGAVLAYASTGRAPFSTGDPGVHGLLFRVAYEDPDVAGVPETVAELVHDCLRKNPADRPTVDALVSRTRKALDGSWLPPDLLARLDEDAADFLRATPRPEPAPRPRPRTRLVEPVLTAPAPAPPVRVRPVRVRPPARRTTARGSLRRPTGLLVAAAVAAYAFFTGAPPFLRASDGTREAAPFAGVWHVDLPGTIAPFVLRLDVTNSTEVGRPSGGYVAATDKGVCQGEATLAGRTRGEMVLADFRVVRSTPDGLTAKECGLPAEYTLVQGPGDSDVTLHRGVDVILARVDEPAAGIPQRLLNVWSSGSGQVVVIRRGTVGDPVVRTVTTQAGRHCESTAALLLVDGGRLVTTPAVTDRTASDAGCQADAIAWNYAVDEDPARPLRLVLESSATASVRRLGLVR
ncbi:serine/threonine-protein kinase [Streptomyces sp. NPDC093089]|uniref:serine/threonine-protein kinase n=1 Tax=Streptomyces sp. NPDC093089 TaxID=3366024 RepID=UPI0038306D66